MTNKFRNGDSQHEVIDLDNGAELHRFLNEAGVPYSAIIVAKENAKKKCSIFSCKKGCETL